MNPPATIPPPASPAEGRRPYRFRHRMESRLRRLNSKIEADPTAAHVAAYNDMSPESIKRCRARRRELTDALIKQP